MSYRERRAHLHDRLRAEVEALAAWRLDRETYRAGGARRPRGRNQQQREGAR